MSAYACVCMYACVCLCECMRACVCVQLLLRYFGTSLCGDGCDVVSVYISVMTMTL